MGWILIVAHIIGALTSVKAIMDARTPQGTIAWAVSLNTIPIVAVPAYWVFGRSKFKGYVAARRNEQTKIKSQFESFNKTLRDRNLVAGSERSEPLLVEKLAALPMTRGNSTELLIDGEATFDSIIEGIQKAEDYALVQFYIIRDDGLGRRLKDALIDRSKAGVRCYLLYDEFGSRLSRGYLSDLRASGVEVVPFNTTKGPGNRFQLNFRNHRKIVIVDGKTAWVGGHNVGDDYLGLYPDMGAWRDTHVRLAGPCVPCIQVPFVEDWHWATGDILNDLNWEPSATENEDDINVLSLPTGPADPIEASTLFFLTAINSAEERLWIASPYFVPDEQIISALELAALRGVDVRVIIPGNPDGMMVDLSAWSYMQELEAVGIQVFRYEEGFLHQKVMLVDDRYATVGTANFDNRSFRLNFEITMVFDDVQFASQVEAMLLKDLERSRKCSFEELQKRGFWFRFGTRVARLLAPVQ